MRCIWEDHRPRHLHYAMQIDTGSSNLCKGVTEPELRRLRRNFGAFLQNSVRADRLDSLLGTVYLQLLQGYHALQCTCILAHHSNGPWPFHGRFAIELRQHAVSLPMVQVPIDSLCRSECVPIRSRLGSKIDGRMHQEAACLF